MFEIFAICKASETMDDSNNDVDVLFLLSDKYDDSFAAQHQPELGNHRYNSGRRAGGPSRTFYNRRVQHQTYVSSAVSTGHLKDSTDKSANKNHEVDCDVGRHDYQVVDAEHGMSYKNPSSHANWKERSDSGGIRGSRSHTYMSSRQQALTTFDHPDSEDDLWPSVTTESTFVYSSAARTSVDIPLSPCASEGRYCTACFSILFV